ncbi:Uu.00g138070.m01.CDS01 [Anthostomella pinea]|uniref:Uu.00g138070.m01.CDS01 n=1 Tax=Anthostomella pinea TaxID=933095 RepID=A0AAI8VPQ2_9PEZI|nr:Uu.00g138070.m01.CDS01 [Anthostomella pinea]
MPSATSSKRSRRAAFDDDGDESGDGVSIAQASSSLRNETQRKKARVSNAGPSRKSAWTAPERDSPASDEDEVMQQPEAPPTPPPATQYELMRDADFRHLEHTEQDDQRATQRLQNQPVLIGENHASLNAIIESITCCNFMCHVRLHCELGPLLNFIVGENGSGKSAILTAITLCLGGKASATNRGGSLRSFVKEGQESASLTVKIKNEGDDAYKPDLFGGSITFERWFNKSGSSGFKLKSAGGRVISTKKGDVDDVVEYFCLQVDNPLNVLSQDNARQFLNAATPATKYKYFVQGTQLEQLDHDYQLLTEMLDANEAKLAEYSENLTYLKDKYEKAVKLRDALGKSSEMRAKTKVYKNQLAWAQVLEQEIDLEKKENNVETTQEEITRMEQEIDEKSEVLQRINDKIQQATEGLQSIQMEESQIQEQEREAKAKYDEARTEIQTMHTQERDMHSQVTKATNQVKNYENSVREEERRLELANGGALTVIQKELEDAKQAKEDASKSAEDHKRGLEALNRDSAAAQAKLQESGEAVEQKRKEIKAAESQVQLLSRNRSDLFAGYEAQVPQLLRLIESENGFREKPVGPIGFHLQLAKAQWSQILERTLGGNLNAFVVTSKADQQRLNGLMQRLRIINCPILIASHARIGNNLREPDPEFDTILRVLKIDNHLVRDQLIINNQIDQVLLIESREEAQHVMFDGQPPQNVSACLVFHDGKRGHGLRLYAGGGGNISSSPITPNFKQKPRIKSDAETEIKYHQENLAQLQAESRTLKASRRTIQQATQRCSQAVAQHVRQTKSLEQAINNAGVRVSKIEGQLDDFDGIDAKLHALKKDLEQAQQTKDHYGVQYGDFAARKAEMNKDVEDLKKEFQDAKTVSRDHNAKVAKAEDKVKRFTENRTLATIEKNQAHEQLAIAKVRKEDAQRSRDRQIKIVADWTQQASSIAPERAYIPEGETYNGIERKYEAVKGQIKKLENQVGASQEEVNERTAQAKVEYDSARKNNKNLTSLVDGLKQALMDRLAKYRNFQRHVSAHARTNFGYLLSERGFRGQLLLDHKARKLEVQVEPDETRRNGKGRNTKTLSGGEKSFSSICLLLAIWDAMGSPLRCLDEFDVFMDNVNRAISTNMLITAARRSVGKQFILITPNAIEGRAQVDKDVKIIRLTDPRQRLLADP